MQARQLQVRGCLPSLLALLFVGAVLATAVTASLAFAAVALAAALLAALARRARGLGRTRSEATLAARKRAADVTIEVPPRSLD